MANPKTISREMAISRNDLFRIMSLAFADTDYSIDHDRIILNEMGRTLEIEYVVMKDRCLGSLSLPMMQLQLQFTDHTNSQIEQFIRKFDRSFHRGGG